MSAEIVRAACPHDCPDTCGMLVTVEDGVATKIQGDPSMPFTDGTLCTKVAYYLERTYSPDRLLYPMRRVGPKGKGQFERITWDAALDEIAARLKALTAENPETILPCSYAGTMGMVQYSSMDRRFFHKLGASLLDRTLCSTAGKFGLKATLGGSVGMDPERFDESKLILLWGANPIVSNLHLWSRVQEAKRRGARVIAIDPYRSLSAEKCSQHIALLPGTDGALVGAWRDAAGGIVLSTADFYGFDHAALERADLLAGRRPRVINQSQLGDALTTAQPPVRAMIVYNNNPVAVCPESDKVIAGFSRDDLFTVVMDHFQTDTADYADIVLPATTQLEHYDVHKSYGHLYVLANNPAIAPVGESLPNSEVFRRLAARMGFDEPCFRDSDEDICRTALASSKEAMRGIEWNALKKAGWQKLGLPERFTPFAAGGFPTASGKCEFYSEWLEKQGVEPLPFYNPPVEAPGADTELARKYPLAFISPPARPFLHSSFPNLARFPEFEPDPHLDMHRSDAERRGIRDGDLVRVFNDRGGYTLRARVNGKPRPGVVVAPSVWWKKYSRDGGNANNVTSQRTTDLGGGATFYDCLVRSEER